MKYLITISFYLLCLKLFAQHTAQIEGEWLLPSNNRWYGSVIKFKDGRVNSEFCRKTTYIIKDNHLTIYEDFKITQAPVYEEMREKGYFTRIDSLNFIIRKVDSDSLILVPDNLSAKEFADMINRPKIGLSVKFYRRELSHKKIKFDSIQLSMVNRFKFILTIDSRGKYYIKSNKTIPTKFQQLTQVESQQLDSCLYISNLESFKIPPKFDRSYKQGDKLILFENSESVTIGLNGRGAGGEYWMEIPWTLKPLFDFLNSLAEKNK